MSQVTYPKRPSHFALKAIRAMVKTCVANEHGSEVMALLTVVVSTEDAAHYRRPVTFHGGQLMPLIGVMSETTFKRVRQRAVDSGWLVYVPGAKRKPASYFVTIPRHAQGLDDKPTDEGVVEQAEPDCGPNTGSDSGPNTGSKFTKIRHEIEPESGRNPDLIRPTFIPIPNPIPIPPSEEYCSEPSPKASKPEPVEVAMEFPVVGGKSPVWPLARSKLAEWADAFPGVSVEDECRLARQWCIDNPTRRKTAGGMTKFLNAWLTKAQNDGRSNRRPSGSLFAAPGGTARSREEQREAANHGAIAAFLNGSGVCQGDAGLDHAQADRRLHAGATARLVLGAQAVSAERAERGGGGTGNVRDSVPGIGGPVSAVPGVDAQGLQPDGW